MAQQPASKNPVRELPARDASGPKINWDDSQMKSSYANVCNAIGTREEVVLFFGMGNPSQSGGQQITVSLSQRVILSPFAAKRLATLLNNVIGQYETRWGALEVGASAAAEPEHTA